MEIDGSQLEGGGQILRNSVTLGCLMRKVITVYNIRGKRSQPGLKAQHLHGLRLVREMCGGELSGDAIASTNVTLHPRVLTSGVYEVDVQTAGSVCLLMQVSIPLASFAPSPTQITYKGGTNAEMAPPIDYYLEVFKPIAERFGMTFSCNIERRGFYPKGGGVVRVKVQPCKQLRAVEMTQFGDVTEVWGIVVVAGKLSDKVAHEISTAAKNHVQDHTGHVTNIKFQRCLKNIGTGVAITLFAKTSTGCILGGSSIGRKGKSSSVVGTEAASALVQAIKERACVDTYLQDQLIILMALAPGHSRILTSCLTMHTQTAIFIAEKLTKAKFKILDTEDSSRKIIECEGGPFSA